ncbi:MAG: peptidylprolyl isomerase [Myxococcota bacterium]
MVLFVWLVACADWLASEPEPEPVVEAPVEAIEPDAAEGAPQLAASHILVAFEGAVGASPEVTRTEAEAKARATELHTQLTAGTDFRELAQSSSDDASGRRGGRIGAFVPDAVDPAFAEAVAATEVGSLSAPFRTPYGWHVARREAVDVARARHIMVSFEGARQSSESHSRAHARRMLDMLETRLQRGADFGVLAAEFSNDVTAEHGGDLGPVGEGQLLPVLEETIASLRPGQRTIVESPYGWHLVERTE